MELNPNFALAHAFLANALILQGAHQEAVESAEHALRLSPRDRHVGALRVARDGDGPFHRRAVFGVRHLGEKYDREKSGVARGDTPF